MRTLLPLLLAIPLAGCVTGSYVDSTASAAAGATRTSLPAGSPRAVQLAYDFRTNGQPDARATEYTTPIVLDAIEKSGLYRVVTDASPETPRLALVIDNVFDKDEARREGFRAGMTLGLSGTAVTDNYVGTATYEAPGKPADSAKTRHALHTAIGSFTPSSGHGPMKLEQAVPMVVQQVTLNTLQALASGDTPAAQPR